MTRTANLATCCKPRPIRFGRWGLAEQPMGQIVLCCGRLYDCIGAYRREYPSPAIMLRVRHFDHSEAQDIAAGACSIVPGHFHEEMS